jgi:hypothetical protein
MRGAWWALQELEQCVSQIDTSSEELLADSLALCRDTVMLLQIPQELTSELMSVMKDAGMYQPASEDEWQAAFTALKGVWASKVRWIGCASGG